MATALYEITWQSFEICVEVKIYRSTSWLPAGKLAARSRWQSLSFHMHMWHKIHHKAFARSYLAVVDPTYAFHN